MCVNAEVIIRGVNTALPCHTLTLTCLYPVFCYTECFCKVASSQPLLNFASCLGFFRSTLLNYTEEQNVVFYVFCVSLFEPLHADWASVLNTDSHNAPATKRVTAAHRHWLTQKTQTYGTLEMLHVTLSFHVNPQYINPTALYNIA